MEQSLPLRTIDLFAGIGGIRLGFEHFGCQNVFTSEWDSDAQTMYHANFGDMPHGDITAIAPEDIPEHDILLAGFPCQPFSIIGSMSGFADTRGTLFFNIEEILRAKQPSAFLLENVKQLRTHDGGRTFRTILEHLQNLGYTTHQTVLNTLDFGLPQKRERTFIVGFRENIAFSFPKPKGAYTPLAEILEERVESKLYASDMILQKRRDKIKHEPFYPSMWHENKGGNISILPFSCALRAGGSYNYLLVNGERRPSSREMLRLQGFPETFKITVGYSAMRKLTGNSVSVPVIQAIAGEMVKSIRERRINKEVQDNYADVKLSDLTCSKHSISKKSLVIMTHLLEQAVATLHTLPEREQDGIAHLILEELADNQRWDTSFASTQDALARVAQKVRADIAAGKSKPIGFDEL